MTIMDLQGMGEDAARKYFEKERWPNGPVCPFCADKDVVRIGGKSVRPGLLRCRECRKQFRVTVGTIFEDSHLPLHIWLKAFALVCASKKGMSAHQMHRMFGITYKSAWFMAHRIRYAMRSGPLAKKMSGIVEVDETHIGGKPRRPWPKGGPLLDPARLKEAAKKKQSVVALVNRDGESRVFPVKRRSSRTLTNLVRQNVDLKISTVMTDEFPAYKRLDKMTRHVVIDHRNHYALPGEINTNAVESFWALMKRGVRGTFHHISKKHMARYCDEFAFRWNNRHISDVERTAVAAKMIEGKRMTYAQVS